MAGSGRPRQGDVGNSGEGLCPATKELYTHIEVERKSSISSFSRYFAFNFLLHDYMKDDERFLKNVYCITDLDAKMMREMTMADNQDVNAKDYDAHINNNETSIAPPPLPSPPGRRTHPWSLQGPSPSYSDTFFSAFL